MMKLTPVKVPGKNGRDQSKSAVAVRKSQVSESDESSRTANIKYVLAYFELCNKQTLDLFPLLTFTQNRSRGRPLKLSSSQQKPTSISTHYTSTPKAAKKRSLKNIKSKQFMSPLEKLPTELLANIFYYTMNFNLPRSSPIIAAKLSGEAIWKKTVIQAFGQTWDDWYGFSENHPPEEYWRGIRHRPGDHELQVSSWRLRY